MYFNPLWTKVQVEDFFYFFLDGDGVEISNLVKYIQKYQIKITYFSTHELDFFSDIIDKNYKYSMRDRAKRIDEPNGMGL